MAYLIASMMMYKYLKRNNMSRLERTFEMSTHVLDSLNVPYILSYGTALGVTRGNALIDYDDDVDLAIFYKDLKNIDMTTVLNRLSGMGFRGRAKNSLPYTYSCKGNFYPVLYQFDNVNTSIGLDIYILYEHGDKIWDFSGGGEKSGLGYSFPSNVNIPEVYYKKFDRKYRAFPREWLRVQYGDDYEVPKVLSKGRKASKINHNVEGCILPPPQ